MFHVFMFHERREVEPMRIASLAIVLSLLSTATRAEEPANPATYLAPQIDLLQLKWPKNRAVNIVCHGHSVPAGYFATPVVDTMNDWFGSRAADAVAAFSVITHFDGFQKGILDSRDVLFFLSLIGFSLFSTSVILRGHRAG